MKLLLVPGMGTTSEEVAAMRTEDARIYEFADDWSIFPYNSEITQTEQRKAQWPKKDLTNFKRDMTFLKTGNPSFITLRVQRLVKLLRSYLRNQGAIYAVCHSHGALLMKNALSILGQESLYQEGLRRSIVITLGPASIIPIRTRWYTLRCAINVMNQEDFLRKEKKLYSRDPFGNDGLKYTRNNKILWLHHTVGPTRNFRAAIKQTDGLVPHIGDTIFWSRKMYTRCEGGHRLACYPDMRVPLQNFLNTF